MASHVARMEARSALKVLTGCRKEIPCECGVEPPGSISLKVMYI